MIYTVLDTFYVSEEELANSPSRSDGVDAETEAQLRSYGCQLVQQGTILLKLPQAVAATGQVILHRFFCKRSMVEFSVKRVAAACTWLSAKLEEMPRRIRDVLSVFYRLELREQAKPLEPLDVFSKRFEEFKADVFRIEKHILRAFGFIMHVEHPHRFVLNYLQIMKAEKELKQEAWNLANDSLRTTLCVRLKGEVVACGLIYMAARRLQVALPENPPWWELFSVMESDLFAVCREMVALYKQPKAVYVEVRPRSAAAQTSAAPASPAAQGLSPLPLTSPSPLPATVGVANGDLADAAAAAGASADRGSDAAMASVGGPAGQVQDSKDHRDRQRSASKDSESRGARAGRTRDTAHSHDRERSREPSRKEAYRESERERGSSSGRHHGERQRNGSKEGRSDMDTRELDDRGREKPSRPAVADKHKDEEARYREEALRYKEERERGRLREDLERKPPPAQRDEARRPPFADPRRRAISWEADRRAGVNPDRDASKRLHDRAHDEDWSHKRSRVSPPGEYRRSRPASPAGVPQSRREPEEEAWYGR